MKRLHRILAVIVGLVAGSIVNMGLVLVGPHIIPVPEGVDVSDVESMAASVHLFGPQHFVFPFLAHALGTVAGCLVAFLLEGSRRSVVAYVTGGLFLLGGFSAAVTIPAPKWFIVLDLVVAYIPMAWIAIRLGGRISGGAPEGDSA